MPKLIMPKANFKELLRRRREWGGDRRDEVWDGVYVMSPDPNNEHQSLVGNLSYAFRQAIGDARGKWVFPGCNVSNNAENWRKNYRIPDVAVFLPGNQAENRDTHWLGGPDFAVEIISKGDRSRKKFDFYAKVNVGELLLVGRKPWKLELHRCHGTHWDLVGVSDLTHPEILPSEALSLTFRLIPGEDRPEIEITHADGRSWLA